MIANVWGEILPKKLPKFWEKSIRICSNMEIEMSKKPIKPDVDVCAS
jgi:hypothetical protein